MGKHALYAFAAAALTFYSSTSAFAETKILVGTAAGGGYDFAARLMAPFLEKHLGESVIVQNVPGGGSLNLARQMAVSKANDEIGLIISAQITQARLDPSHVAVDFSTFKWLGSLNSATSICITSKASNVDDFDAFISSDLKMGATSQTGSIYTMTALIKNVFGAKFEIVTGFTGLTDIEAAMERGELDGYCGEQVDRYVRNDQKGTYSLIGSLTKDVEIDGKTIPSFVSSAPNELDQAAMKLYSVSDDIYYPFFVAPGASDEAVSRYREAFSAVLTDEEFLAKAAEFYSEINPMDAGTLIRAVDSVAQAKAETVEHLNALVK